jgi:pyruvate dehydrogenase E1 component alpha subunit
MITKEELIKFEKELSELFLQKKIRVPIHLSGGNEEQLIRIFKYVKKDDWVLSTHRNHYHALLKGYDKEKLKQLILSGESMHIYSKEHKFLTSAIVGGILPIAIGLAMAIRRRNGKETIWVFVGDMGSEMGIFHECTKYADRNDLPIRFVIEDNGLSTDTPTEIAWGTKKGNLKKLRYEYKRKWPHVGCGKWVSF